MRCGTGSHTTINLRQEGWAAEAGVGLHTHKVAPARLFHPSIHNQATPGQTGTGTDTQTTERRQPDTSTPSKQRDRHGVTHTTHHSDSQPSHSDSTGRRQAHPRGGSLEGKEVLSRKGALMPKHRPTTMPAWPPDPRTARIQRIPRHPHQRDAVQPVPRKLPCHKDT